MRLYGISASFSLRGEGGKEAQESLREEVQAAISAALRELFDQGVRVEVDSIVDVGPAGGRRYERELY